MKDDKEARDSILITMLDAHPKPKWWKRGIYSDSISYCMDGGNCDCPFVQLSSVKTLVRRGLVRLNERNGYVLTEPKGLRVATLVWNRYCLRDGKKKLMKQVPA